MDLSTEFKIYEEKKKDRIEEANKELKKIKSHVGDFNTHMQ